MRPPLRTSSLALNVGSSSNGESARGRVAAELPLARLCGLVDSSPLLDPRRLSAILRTCGAFPSNQRLYAWRFALQPHWYCCY